MAQTAAQMGFLRREAATAMLAWQHSGFSVDASVRISPSDRDVPAYFQSLALGICEVPFSRHLTDHLGEVAGMDWRGVSASVAQVWW